MSTTVYTVKSGTSGQPSYANLLKKSKVRELLGLRCVQMEVSGSSLKGITWRKNWYYEHEVTIVGMMF